jgi:methionyl-tRNA formyltransferase
MRPTKNSKIIFFGTPEISAQVLRSLLDAGYEISAIVTNPDAPVGRHHVMTPSPVKVLAQERGIPVLTPEKLDSEFYALLTTNYKLHLGIVVAYGKIIPQNIIDSFPLGMLNIHYSLLPKYRGASPVENAILAGDATTGVTIQKLVFKLDAGPIVAVREFEIDNEITSPELKIKLTEVGSELLLETLPHYLNNEITLVEQDETLATHCKKISKSDGEIKLSDPDESKWLKYRAYFGWPGIFYFDENNKRVKITLATFEDNKFIIKKVIPEGRTEIEV